MNRDITSKYHKGNPESEAAHRSLDTERIRARVVALVRRQGLMGATSDELERMTDLAHQTVSARLTEAKADGTLVDSGRRRPTRSGRNAAVMVAPEFATVTVAAPVHAVTVASVNHV